MESGLNVTALYGLRGDTCYFEGFHWVRYLSPQTKDSSHTSRSTLAQREGEPNQRYQVSDELFSVVYHVEAFK